jgi:hypothetical protein
MANTNANIPDFSISIVDPSTGLMNPVWFQFLIKLFDRTGGETGNSGSLPTSAINTLYGLVGSQLIPTSSTDEPHEAFWQSVLTDPLLHAIVTATDSGFMSAADKVKIDTMLAGAAVASVSGTAPIVSSGGSTPVISISAATTTTPGSLSAADKTKLDSVTSGAAVSAVSGTAPIVSSGGTSPAISIANATTTTDGSMIASDKVKLNGIAAGAQVNVATNIGQGTLTATTIPLTSSTGTGTTLPSATTSLAGLLSAADKLKLDGVTAGAAVAAVTGTAPITSSGGASPAIGIAAATSLVPGSMSAADKAKLDAATSIVTGVTGTAPISSSGGTNPAISIVAATPSVPGSMSASDKSKLDGIAAGAQVNVSTNLALGTTTTTTQPVTNSNGTGFTLAGASPSLAGLLASADKSKLDGIAAGAQVNVATNIGIGTVTATAVPLTSSTGTGASLTGATALLAGLLSAADKSKIDGIGSGATVTGVTGTAPIVSSGGASPAISISPATTTTPGSLSASDKLKLDAITPGIAPSSMGADVTATNSTADVAIVSLTAPANSLVAGSVITVDISGVITAATLAATLSFWVKVGTTKVIGVDVVMPAALSVGVAFKMQAICTVRASSLIQMTADVQCAQPAYSPSVYTPNPFSTSGSGAFVLTASNTITAGFNWSVAGASNTATAKNCLMAQRK